MDPFSQFEKRREEMRKSFNEDVGQMREMFQTNSRRVWIFAWVWMVVGLVVSLGVAGGIVALVLHLTK